MKKITFFFAVLIGIFCVIFSTPAPHPQAPVINPVSQTLPSPDKTPIKPQLPAVIETPESHEPIKPITYFADGSDLPDVTIELLVQDHDLWPKKITIGNKSTASIIKNGAVIGTTTIPPGDIDLVEVQPDSIVGKLGEMTVSLCPQDTDIFARAAALEKSQVVINNVHVVNITSVALADDDGTVKLTTDFGVARYPTTRIPLGFAKAWGITEQAVRDNLEVVSKKQLAAAQKKLEEEKRAAAQLVEEVGEAPAPDPWDGSFSAVKSYHQTYLKDPRSAEYISWTGPVLVTIRDVKYWGIKVLFRSKNSFGGYALAEDFVLIQHGSVVKYVPGAVK